MYFPIGWPKIVKTPDLGQDTVKQIVFNRDRILFALLTDDCLMVWFCKPCVIIAYLRRSLQSLEKLGTNVLVEWKPDSSMIVVVTSEGHLLFYTLGVIADSKGLYMQTDSPYANLKRDSAELFIKEIIPPLELNFSKEVLIWDGKLTGIVCITMLELMISTNQGHVLRYKWDGTEHRDYNLDLRRIPFCINQQVSKAIPIVEDNTYIINIEYSPLVGGFSIVLNDGRAAFLTASSLKFDPNQVQGIWAQGIEDATCTVMNHKYRLITFGRANSECIVYYIDDSTGGLEVSHNCVLSSKDYPGDPGAVKQVLWTPDGCALVASWEKGGIAMWSTFGSLLMCSLGWDYGLNTDIQQYNPLQVTSMQFSTEGYQLWMVQKDIAKIKTSTDGSYSDGTILMQLEFMKSALTINPCMSHQSHLYLQGEDKLYVNSADVLLKMFSERPNREENVFNESASIASTLAEGRQWLIVPMPSTYSSTNWPIKFSAIDADGQNIAIAGRTGLAHYSVQTRRWKLFGNETQEKDFIVVAGLLWWRDYILMGCYSIVDNADELRFYPRDTKLDNKFAKILKVNSSVLLINIFQDQLITFGSDAQVTLWHLRKTEANDIEILKLEVIDISALSVHPACIASVTLTSLRPESGRGQQNNSESIILNISGRLLMVQRNTHSCSIPTVLASCVENVWLPNKRKAEKAHLTEALWLFCGAHGMRVWLPLYPKDGDKTHTFMLKRIMLPFHLKVYPLAILFEDAIILGAENDNVLYSSDSSSPFSFPFSVIQRTSQVYLHQILRQLIRRNLGYHAWEIARSCMSLPYFPHSLELLLHEVLEEEATSKEPIPDAQLPSVIEFIMEFSVYLETVVQCARKTEIALWPYLFSAAGKPKDLFQECMAKRQLDTAASYLIILQNLETSSVSRQYATLLLNTALEQSKWDLAKDLVRFLRAIDPNDAESPRTSFILPAKLGLTQQQSTVSPNAEDLSLILSNVQVSRVRSYSTTILPKTADTKVNTNANYFVESPQSRRKKSVPNTAVPNKQDSRGSPSNSAEDFFIDVILQKHARRLLSEGRLTDLGYFAAHLDFHLVAWLGKEKNRAARVDDFVQALKHLHEEFSWPYPFASVYQHDNTGATQMDIQDRLKTMKQEINCPVSSRVGDSGYMSLQGLAYTGFISPMYTFDSSSQIADTEIEGSTRSDVDSHNNKIIDNKCNLTQNFHLYNTKISNDYYNCNNDLYALNNNSDRTLDASSKDRVDDSVMSTVSSLWEEDRTIKESINLDNWEVPSSQILEQLSNTDNKGSNRSEVQLRYLLQLFMEASCLEWSLLISILLRDAMAVLRTVNAVKSHDQTIESVSRLYQGLSLLQFWTNNECLGYRSFMLAIQNQISVLCKILETKVQHQKIVEYQQAVSASLNKISSSNLSRSHKLSSNFDIASQSGSTKEKKSISSGHGSSENFSEISSTIGKPEMNLKTKLEVTPQKNNCTLS